MLRQDAERIISEYVKPVFGFALKRCRTAEDAEDLSQEIILRAFRSFLVKDDIGDTDKFIWTVAHNTIANYYRDKARVSVGVPIDELVEVLTDGGDITDGIEASETEEKLHREIAYLSKLQRQIIIQYYYENRRQSDIAKSLGIPLGTVKWHLFEAKKELKRGMETVRNSGELKFNPVRFENVFFSGSVGEKGSPRNFIRSALAQNILYVVRNTARTINDIADALGVSPVYVENEIEFLEEYGIVLKKGDKYICNIIIEEETDELVRMQDEMYNRAADIIAPELYDELMTSGILDNEGILGGITGDFTFTYTPPRDTNYMLWALLPYIAAVSGEELFDRYQTVIFDEVATIRPDGGKNLMHAYVETAGCRESMYSDEINNFSGPYYNGSSQDFVLWGFDTAWSGKRVNEMYHRDVYHDLSILKRYVDSGELSAEEYAYLAEKGYIAVVHESYDKVMGEKPDLQYPSDAICAMYKTGGTDAGAVVCANRYDGCTKSCLRVLHIFNAETKQKLLAIGDRIKEKHWAELEAIRKPYIDATLAETPDNQRKMREFEMQYIFFSDRMFVIHCIMNLLNSGKLKQPTEEQRKSLSMLLIQNK